MESAEELKRLLGDYIVELENFVRDKPIGKGGYGKVDLGTDLRTGRKVAIKELFLTELEGRQLKLFCREVMVLAKCNNMFLLSLDGFTINHPYMIVTDYIPNGSLYDALHGKKGAPTLTPTNRTIIAMGIAYGMQYLHELGIIHRDLKSLNILLDEKLYPKICDFGISRFKNDTDTLPTAQIGTPHWMAPELFYDRGYTNKVDVYAYGILLWEILTGQTPFKGRNAVSIMNAVCTNAERPLFPSDTTDDIKNLINLCWYQTPTTRPTFQNIFQLFKDKRVYFPGTDLDEVDNFIKEIERFEFLKGRKGLPKIPTLENNEKPSIESMLPILHNPRHLEFSNTLHIFADTIPMEESKALFDIISEALNSGPQTEALSAVYRETLFFLKKHPKIVVVFITTKEWDLLKIPDPQIFMDYFNLVHFILGLNKEALTIDDIRLLAGQAKSHPEEVSILFGELLEADRPRTDYSVILDTFLSVARSMITSGDPFQPLRVVQRCFEEHTDSTSALNKVFMSINSGLQADDEVAIRVYSALYVLKIYHPSEDIVYEHLSNPKTAKPLLAYMSEMHPYAYSVKILRLLLNFSKNTIQAVFAVSNLAQKESNALAIIQNLDVMDSEGFDPISALHILSSVSSHKSATSELLEHSNAFKIFISAIKKDESQSIATIASIINSATLSQEALHVIVETHFIEELNDIEKKSNMESFVHCTKYINQIILQATQGVTRKLKS